VLTVASAVIAATAFLASLLLVRDTAAHVALEQAQDHLGADLTPPSLRSAFARATYHELALRSCSQAGLVNNLNDGLAWGLLPLFLAAHGTPSDRSGSSPRSTRRLASPRSPSATGQTPPDANH